MIQARFTSILLVTLGLCLLGIGCARGSSSSKGGPVSLKQLPLSFDLPADWQVTRDDVTSSGSYAALGYKKLDQIAIEADEIVFDNAEAFEQAWLAKQSDVKIVSREKFANGFGFTYVQSRKGFDDKTLIHYHVKIGSATYQMASSSIYYDVEQLPTAIAIIKAAKPRAQAK